MAKSPTPRKPPAVPAAPLLVAALTPALFAGLRDAYLATITWPAETPDDAKALAVEHVNGFIAHLCTHAETAGLVAKAVPDVEAAVESVPEKGMIEVVVSGPREGRRRIGRAFTESATAPFFVTPGELESLKADPKLLVQLTGAVAA